MLTRRGCDFLFWFCFVFSTDLQRYFFLTYTCCCCCCCCLKGYFHGHKIVEAVLNMTRDDYTLTDATDVILTGCSAGGIGTFFNCDFVAEYMKALNPNTRVSCRPEAGWFGLPIKDYNRCVRFRACFPRALRMFHHFHLSFVCILWDLQAPHSDTGWRCSRCCAPTYLPWQYRC